MSTNRAIKVVCIDVQLRHWLTSIVVKYLTSCARDLPDMRASPVAVRQANSLQRAAPPAAPPPEGL